MKLFLLLCLLALGRTTPQQPMKIKEVLRSYDLMMADAGDDDDDDNDIDEDDGDSDEDDELEDCPKGCHCWPRVMQCSDKGLISVPDKIAEDTVMIDLQNNDITDIGENDFKGLNKLYALFILNNKISKIHPQAFKNMDRLKLLYLSYNLLVDIPANLPRNLVELRLHANRINNIKKGAFKGLRKLHVLEMSANKLSNSGVSASAFDDMSTLYMGLAENDFTMVPKDLPSAMTELSLEYNKISKVEVEDLLRYKHLERLGLSFNQIRSFENGTLLAVPQLKDLSLDNNKLKRVPGQLSSLPRLQVVLLHANKISSVGLNDFCPSSGKGGIHRYSGISLFANPVRYWNIPPPTFRCVGSRRSIQLGNFKRRK